MAWGDGKPKPGLVLRAAIGEGTCHVCLNPLRSRLHHELCDVTTATPTNRRTP